MKLLLYPGTFDPVTEGHVDLMRRGLNLSDRVLVAVADSKSKDPFFSLEERVAMIREVTREMKNIDVEPFSGLVVNLARARNAGAILRGLRAVSDFEYEFQMALMNRQLDQEVETMFLMPSARYTYLSASMIRDVAQMGGDVSTMVPPEVHKRLRKKLAT
ncbi:MAG: pantetheine-phosphate adenylyltransferase [Candidatus Eisenbacteria sp.]|nr:pantetheine-phosphate adenylyltransferase [Candidatus Eisenbacteria bacterium]